MIDADEKLVRVGGRSRVVTVVRSPGPIWRRKITSDQLCPRVDPRCGNDIPCERRVANGIQNRPRNTAEVTGQLSGDRYHAGCGHAPPFPRSVVSQKKEGPVFFDLASERSAELIPPQG